MKFIFSNKNTINAEFVPGSSTINPWQRIVPFFRFHGAPAGKDGVLNGKKGAG
jgi:hypothetical protein